MKIKTDLKKNRLNLHSLINNYISIFFILFLFANCSGTTPSLVGQFPPCPNTPNCVSSKSSISPHQIRPIKHNGTSLEAREKILKIINSMPRTKIITKKDRFIHVEFTSKVFRFVDDVEFYFEKPETIHFRSASRLGHSDLGVNRKRMDEISKRFLENN